MYGIKPSVSIARQPCQGTGKMLLVYPPTVTGIRCFQPRRRLAIIAFFRHPDKATAERWLP